MKTLDVRELVCAQRHSLIFDTFDSLAVEEAFEFINDHKPTPLYRQFCQRYPDQFSWDYLEEGPQVWRMLIRRTAKGTARVFHTDINLQTSIHTGAVTMTKQIDVRTIPPRERHPKIFDLFDSLQIGESFELINDHAPRPLYYQFLNERTDLFSWENVEEGPDTWRVRITCIGKES